MSSDEETLQRICEEVEAEWGACGLASNDLYADFAKAVARRYAATVGAGVSEGTKRGLWRAMDLLAERYSDWSPEDGREWHTEALPAVNALRSILDVPPSP